MIAPDVANRAACTDMLDVVDAAFEREGSPAQRYLEAEVCPRCPIAKDCLYTALETGEHGPWGGTNRRARNKKVRRPSTFNMRNVNHEYVRAETPAEPRRYRTYHGVTTKQIKEWAVEVGLMTYVARGTVKREIREAYFAAHPVEVAS